MIVPASGSYSSLLLIKVDANGICFEESSRDGFKQTLVLLLKCLPFWVHEKPNGLR